MSARGRRFDVRRRLDGAALRWQARLDTPFVDRTFPWVLGGGLTLVLTAIGLAVQRQLDGGSNLAVWTQAASNLEHGRGTTSSFAGGDVIADQWAFTSLPILHLGRWIPVGIVFAVAQPLLLGLAVVPIWRLARHVGRLRPGVTVALCLAYAAAPILYTSNLTGWSAVVPAVPALAWMAWFGQRRQWIAYGLCLAFALLSRADVGVLLVAMGILGVTSGDRRPGVISAVVGLAWTAAFLLIEDPEIPVGPLQSGEAILARGIAPLAVLDEPLRLVTDLFLQPNVGALVVLVGPLLFLPLTVPRFMLPALPPLVLGLVGEEAIRQAEGPGAPGGDRLPAVLLLAIVPIVTAAMVALARIGKPSVNRIRVDHRIVAAMILATATIFIQVAPASPFNEPWSWGSQDEVDGARLEAVDVLDDVYGDGPLGASPQMAPLVAEREVLHELPVAPPGDRWYPDEPAVVIDTTALDDDGVPLWTDAERIALTQRLVDASYDVEYRAAGIIVLVLPPDER